MHAPILTDSVGIGLRHQHYSEFLERKPKVDFIEVHSENYFGKGGAPHHYLEKIRQDYPLSIHGVGLSLGSADPLSTVHLQRLKDLINSYQPFLVSEHLAWSSVEGIYLNDLLPMPYTDQSLAHFSAHVEQTQDFLGRQILIENPSTYLQFITSTLTEWEFLVAIQENTGCGLLLDVNNIYVSSQNHGYSAHAYIDALMAAKIGEIHLAGHTVKEVNQQLLLIDTHNQRISESVWELYSYTLKHCRAPTLIEWDTDLPPLSTLEAEVSRARDHQQWKNLESFS